MRRIPDWEERLTAVISSSFNRKFEYGSFDCCLFACECIEAVTGKDLSLGLRGSYADSISAALAIRRTGAGNVAALASNMALQNDIPETEPAMAKPGDIVLAERDDESALGVCIGEYALVPTQEGLTQVHMDDWLRVWRIG